MMCKLDNFIEISNNFRSELKKDTSYNSSIINDRFDSIDSELKGITNPNYRPIRKFGVVMKSKKASAKVEA